MAADDLVDDDGKTSTEVDPKGPPTRLATKAERNKEPSPVEKRSMLQDLSDPEIWNSDAVKQARRERWYGKKDR